MFKVVFLALTILINVVMAATAAAEGGLGAAAFAMIGAPVVNLALIAVGLGILAFIPKGEGFSVGTHVCVIVGAPIAAALLDMLFVSMLPHRAIC